MKIKTAYQSALADYNEIKRFYLKSGYVVKAPAKRRGAKINLQKLYRNADPSYGCQLHYLELAKRYKRYTIKTTKKVASVTVDDDGKINLSSVKPGKIGIKSVKLITAREQVERRRANSWTGFSK